MTLFCDEFELCLMQGNLRRAEELALFATSRGTEGALWWNRLGLVCYLQGRFDDALMYFDRAACADPGDAEPLLNGAVVLSDLGFYDEAAGRFEAARDLDSRSETDETKSDAVLSTRSFKKHSAENDVSRAFDLSDVESWDDAKKRLSEAAQENESSLLRLRLGQALLRLGDPTNALRELAKVATAYLGVAEYHVAVALCYLALKKKDDAKSALAKIRPGGGENRLLEMARALALEPENKEAST